MTGQAKNFSLFLIPRLCYDFYNQFSGGTSLKKFNFILYFLFIIYLLTAQSIDFPDRILISNDLVLEKAAENVWVHVSTIDLPPWGPVSANGLVILSKDSITLIDTPWNDRQTEILISRLKEHFRTDVERVIISHFHEDNLGGLEWINKSDIESYSIGRTQAICRAKGLPIPQYVLEDSFRIESETTPIEGFFPGRGHTEDNICIYLPEQKLMFGGCSIKSLSNRSLGNTVDADLTEWPLALKKILEKFPEAETVVPGHGKIGGPELIDHTLSLF